MKIKLIYLVATLFISCVGVFYSWAELTPKEILHRADEARGNLEGVRWKVSIHSVENKRIQKRKLAVKARGYDFLAVLNSPPKVKGQKLLMISHNMWFSKPDLRKPVPVSPRQKLVGGASYGDIAATNYADDFEASPMEDEIVEGEWCYVFDLKARHKRRIVHLAGRDAAEVGDRYLDCTVINTTKRPAGPPHYIDMTLEYQGVEAPISITAYDGHWWSVIGTYEVDPALESFFTIDGSGLRKGYIGGNLVLEY